MPRIPLASPENLTPEQRRVHEAITGARGGKLPAPYRLTLLHSPEITDKWQQLGDVLRHRISFPPRLAELAIIITAHHWHCPYVWHAHAPQAQKGGVPPDVIEAIRRGQRPRFEQADEEAIYAFCTELLRNQEVSAATYQGVQDPFGSTGTVELTALVGYYVSVAMALKAHDFPVPAEAASLFPLS